MKERPILFSAPMVRALLAGTKAQTRRVVKWRGLDKGLNLQFSGLRAVQDRSGMWALESDTRTSRETRCDVTPCPYGQPGDHLWVREAWAHTDGVGLSGGMLYRADFPAGPRTIKYKPGIHMPRWASRITLEVTGVRVERPQDISYEDAIAEGITDPATIPAFPECMDRGETVEQYCRRKRWPQRQYAEPWDSINGPGSWDANPWVWVVEFRRLEQKEGRR